MTKTAQSEKTSTAIQPLGGRVLLRRIEETESMRGGIYIPDSAREKPQEAEVIALGTGKTNDKGERVAFEVKAGDRVLISQYGGTEVKLGEDKFLLISEDDILGIIG